MTPDAMRGETPMASIISVSRESDYSAILRKYRVIIDEEKVGELPDDGNELSFFVTPGLHKVQVTIDRWKSNPVSLNTLDRVTCYLECGCNLQGWRLTLSLLVGSLFGRWFFLQPVGWIWLRTASTPTLDANIDKSGSR